MVSRLVDEQIDLDENFKSFMMKKLILDHLIEQVSQVVYFICKLGDLHNIEKVESEIDFSLNEYIIRPDLVLKNQNEALIVDFKLSSLGIPNASEITHMKSVQLSFYQSIYEQIDRSIKVTRFIYLSIEDLSKSKAYILCDSILDEENIKNDFKNSDEGKFFKNYNISISPLVKNRIPQLKQFNELRERILQDQVFLPSSESKICRFCRVRMLCELSKA